MKTAVQIASTVFLIAGILWLGPWLIEELDGPTLAIPAVIVLLTMLVGEPFAARLRGQVMKSTGKSSGESSSRFLESRIFLGLVACGGLLRLSIGIVLLSEIVRNFTGIDDFSQHPVALWLVILGGVAREIAIFWRVGHAPTTGVSPIRDFISGVPFLIHSIFGVAFFSALASRPVFNLSGNLVGNLIMAFLLLFLFVIVFWATNPLWVLAHVFRKTTIALIGTTLFGFTTVVASLTYDSDRIEREVIEVIEEGRPRKEFIWRDKFLPFAAVEKLLVKETGLETLVIENAQIDWLPSGLSALTQLRRVSLKDCDFKNHPLQLSHFPDLVELDLSGNNLIDSGAASASLEVLNLSRNRIRELREPEVIRKRWPQLKELDLSENPISPEKIEALRAQLPTIRVVY